MKINGLIRVLEACRDAADGDVEIVIMDEYEKAMEVQSTEWDWLEKQIVIKVGPKRRPQNNSLG